MITAIKRAHAGMKSIVIWRLIIQALLAADKPQMHIRLNVLAAIMHVWGCREPPLGKDVGAFPARRRGAAVQWLQNLDR